MIGLNRPKGINIKNNIELNYLRQSGKMLNSVKKTIKKNIEEGITTKELDYIAEKEILNLGGKPGFKGLYGFPGTICSSFNEEIVHGIPSDRKIKDGDIISIDCGVIYEEFNTDSAFTLGIGNLPVKTSKLIKTTLNSLPLGIKEATPNNHIGDIGHAVESYSTNNGFSVVKEYVGLIITKL